MTTSWDYPPSGKGEVPREFIVNNVELYLSQAASAAFRKVRSSLVCGVRHLLKRPYAIQPLPAQRKKLERRDSIKPLSNPDDKKLKGASFDLLASLGLTQAFARETQLAELV